METKICGIYKIINPKGKIYIGQSTDIGKRKQIYKTIKCKGQIKIYNSLKKYGFENHKFEIIEECSIEQLNERERYWQDYYNVLKEGLNCRLTKTNDRSGITPQEIRDKIGKSNTGKTHTDLTKLKMSESAKGNQKCLGRIWSDESKEKISKANKGRKFTSEQKFKLSKAKEGNQYALGYKFTQLQKEKLSKSKEGKNCKIIIQYDLEDNFIKEWNSLKEVKTNFKGDIGACCRGKQNTAGGFKWKFKIYNNE